MQNNNYLQLFDHIFHANASTCCKTFNFMPVSAAVTCLNTSSIYRIVCLNFLIKPVCPN